MVGLDRGRERHRHPGHQQLVQVRVGPFHPWNVPEVLQHPVRPLGEVPDLSLRRLHLGLIRRPIVAAEEEQPEQAGERLGCEYDVVIMVGLDLGCMPWRDEVPEVLREGRRLFYVGLMRAHEEVHMLPLGVGEDPPWAARWGRSPFVEELEARLGADVVQAAGGAQA